MDPAPAPYLIRIHGHLGAALALAFPALAPRQQGACTVLTGLLDQSALFGVLAGPGRARRWTAKWTTSAVRPQAA